MCTGYRNGISSSFSENFVKGVTNNVTKAHGAFSLLLVLKIFFPLWETDGGDEGSSQRSSPIICISFDGIKMFLDITLIVIIYIKCP